MTQALPQFGTAGIRGLTNTEIGPEVALALGRALPAVLGVGEVVIGRDTRHGGVMLCAALAAGLASRGVRVVDVGMLPTPAISTAVVARGAVGGVTVTGSHTAWERTGLIPVDAAGATLGGERARAVEAAMRSPPAPVAPEAIPRPVTAPEAREAYVDGLLRQVSTEGLRARGYRVAVDPANGAASRLSGDVLEAAGCEVVRVHDEPAPKPERASEPRGGGLAVLAERVRVTGCDLGVGFDPDADRAVFLDADGVAISEDVIGALLARATLEAGDTCVTPVNASGIMGTICEQQGARHVLCRIGQAAIAEAMAAEGASYAYEESGKYFFGDVGPWCDGIGTTLRVLGTMLSAQSSLRTLADALPACVQRKQNVRLPTRHVAAVMERVRARFDGFEAPDLLDRRTLDGLQLVFADRAWLLLRPSGTEPLLRVYADAPTEERADALVARGRAWVDEALQGETA